MSFESFNEIVRFNSSVVITEKLNGTNAQVWIFEYSSTNGTTHEVRLGIMSGSRNRWVTPEDDNYGFGRWVHENREALISTLGVGRHFGEWFGSGIDVGYGLPKGEKRLALFDIRWRSHDLSQVPGLTVVPVLYQGPYKDGIVPQVMDSLKTLGSAACPGFMRPEGIVIRFDRNGATFKMVFDPEETAWKKGKSDKPVPATAEDVLPFLQPIRLEKILLRDERFAREFPSTVPALAGAYLDDLVKESPEYHALNDLQIKAVRRAVFPWIKTMMKEKGYES